jgi:hypothetical protein
MTDTANQSALVKRAQAILTTPKTEWPVIADEPATMADIYTKYILILAAIPVLANFISYSILGVNVPIVGMYRVSVVAGISNAIVTYILTLVGVFVTALVADALAPSFGGTKNQVQALKAVAYSSTAYWVASIGGILPIIGWLIALAGVIYSLYLLNLGLPATMKSSSDRGVPYTAAVVVCAIVIWLVIGLVVGTVVGGPGMMGRGMMGAVGGPGGAQSQFEPDSPMGRLEQWANRMEQASDNMEAARESGDERAQQDALDNFFGTLLGNDGSVEALAPEEIRRFAPEELRGLSRTKITAQRQGMLGIQVSTTSATYQNDSGDALELEITDVGGASALMSIAAWAGLEEESETASGFERSYHENGRMVHEVWDHNSRSGEYGILVANRFLVQVSGEADNIDDLKRALSEVDLSGLESRAT